MKVALQLTLSFLWWFIIPETVFCQTTDSVRQKPLQNALAWYATAIGEESHLYNGPQYVNTIKYYVTGHQFFRKNEEEPANIYYDGVWYQQVPIRYDIMLDKIVLEHPASEFSLALVNEKVKYFTCFNHTFIRLEKDSTANAALKTGFYDLLYDGHLKMLVKRTKQLQEEATSRGMTGEFKQVNKYYLQKENTYIPVKSKKSVLKALPDKKKQLQRYAREQKIHFRQNHEKAILQLIMFYDQPNA